MPKFITVLAIIFKEKEVQLVQNIYQIYKHEGYVLGPGRDFQQSIRYVFDSDLVDTIRIRYDTHVHDFTFQNQEFWISTRK